MKTLLFFLALLIAAPAGLQAQTWIEKVGKDAAKRAEKRAKNKVEDKVNRKVDKTVDDAFDKTEDAVKSNDKKDNTGRSGSTATTPVAKPDNSGQAAAGTTANAEATPRAAEVNWNKFDFVAGDEILFDDNQAAEQLGEFPSMWDLVGGECEIAQLDGQNVVCMYNGSQIRPLMKDIRNYFGEVFTIEFDYYYTVQEESEDKGSFNLRLVPARENWAGHNIFDLRFDNHITRWNWDHNINARATGFSYSWKTTSDENRNGSSSNYLAPGEWHRISLSFNKRAMKIYSDQVRVANIPNMTADIGWLQIEYGGTQKEYPGYIRNFRIAKGAVPLYDRMMSDGRFITYGITFDIGKTDIKPESMGEINRIVKLMTENPELKFSVEGHTDATGNAAANQTLSEARSKAIVGKLVELGISADRLSASGKGQTTPIADNATDEGRAKNRRVEFVKQ